MWLTENPWPPVIILAALGAGFLFGWSSNRRRAFLAAAAFFFSLGIVAFFVERAIVTEAEQVEATLAELVTACVGGDIEKVLSFFSPQESRLRQTIAGAMSVVDVENDARLTDVDVRLVSQRTQAISHFRVNATISVPQVSHHGRHPSRWELVWRKFEGEWKVIDVKRLNPMNGNEVSLYDSQ